MKKLTNSQKSYFVAGAAKSTGNIGNYLKIFSITSLINLGVGISTSILNMASSAAGTKNRSKVSYSIPMPQTKNVAAKKVIMNM